MKKLLLPFLFLSLFFVNKPAYSAVDTLTIAQAIEDLDMDFVPDRKGDTVMVSGVIISPNFQTSHNSFYLWDGTAGTDIFNLSSVTNGKFNWALGDSLVITGKVDQFNGVTEIVPLDSASWDSVGTGTVPDPMKLTLADYKANPEMYEGSLLWFGKLSKVSGTWPASGSGGSIYLSDGVDTLQFYIDSDTDIDGTTEPLYPVDVVGIGSQYDSSPPLDGGYEILPRYMTDFTSSWSIANAIEDLDMDFIPDHLGDTVRVRGVIISPNFLTNDNSFYLWDGTAGADIFMPGMGGAQKFNWALGDSLVITGYVNQYNGMTEIQALDSASWDSVGTGTVPDPIEITLAEYKANSEMYEGSLILVKGLSLVSGTWPTSSSANLSLSDGVDTVVFRVDSDTDIPGTTEPTWPQDVVGIGSQFDSSDPYSSGYQIFPRYYTDFTPTAVVPVELVSFSASVKDGAVLLRWSTSTEVNNKGFQVERKSSTEDWNGIAFVDGKGTTTNPHIYSYADNSAKSGSYSYRLKQIDFDGSYKYSNVAEVSFAGVTKFELAQNYPNPFNPSTTISFSIPESSNVSLKIFNTLGQEVKTLVSGFKEAGSYKVNFDAKNLTSGLYFYRIEAGTFSQVMKMMLLK